MKSKDKLLAYSLTVENTFLFSEIVYDVMESRVWKHHLL